MKISIGSDHCGVALKAALVQSLSGVAEVLDKGAFDVASCDYCDYAGGALNDSLRDQFGRTLFPFAGFAFETQAHPDSVNKPDWPDTILRPGGTFRSVTEYRFSVA